MIRRVLMQRVRDIERRSEENARILDAILGHLEQSRFPLLGRIKRLAFDLVFAAVILFLVLARVCWRNVVAIVLVAVIALLWGIASELVGTFLRRAE